MKKIVFLGVVIAFALFIGFSARDSATFGKNTNPKLWEFQAIDTMKYSRDPSAEKMNDASFDKVIDSQVKAIADSGATHVGIATPYDEQFVPMLKRWVRAARKYNLKVWFRGNFSGWEKWFGYDQINREEHKRLLGEFIVNNPDLFRDGDVFSPCPECENGGPGDPRQTGDVKGYRQFLIDEREISEEAFKKIDKKVQANYASMNADVARLVMNVETTQKMGGIVVIDHYVKDPNKLSVDAKAIAQSSGGKVILGEYGAPIPDIHGNLSETEQAEWMEAALSSTKETPEIIGMSYWTSVGGSTQLWNENGTKRQVADVIKKYYQPKSVMVSVTNEFGRPVVGASVMSENETYETDKNGATFIPVITSSDVFVQKVDFKPKRLTVGTQKDSVNVALQYYDKPSFWTILLARLGFDF